MNNKANKTKTVVDAKGNKRHYKNGKLHRTNGPAVELADGTMHWYVDGKMYLELTFDDI